LLAYIPYRTQMSHKPVGSSSKSQDVEALAAKLPPRPDLNIAARLQPKPSAVNPNAGFQVTRPQFASKPVGNTTKLAPIPPIAPSAAPAAPAAPSPLTHTIREAHDISLERPSSAHGKTVLPSIATNTKSNPAKNAAFEMDLPAEVDELNAAGPLAIVEFVRLKAVQHGFLYLAEMPWQLQTAGIYSLKIVPHSAINPEAYYTISCGGVTHVLNSMVEFTPLERWIQEYDSVSKLLRKKTFSNFRIWKAFATWRKSVITTKRHERSISLQAHLFILDEHLRPPLMSIRALCLSLVDMKLCAIDATKTYTLDEFLHVQHAQLKSVSDRLGGFRDQVKGIVLQVCKQILAAAGFSESTGTRCCALFLNYNYIIYV
jgi:hypothetical protein